MKYGICNGELITPNQVLNGAKCYCINCKKPLSVYENHFQHYSGTCNLSDTELLIKYIADVIKNNKGSIRVQKTPTSPALSLYHYNLVSSKIKDTTSTLCFTDGDFYYYFYIGGRNIKSVVRKELPLYEEQTGYRIYIVNVTDLDLDNNIISEINKTLYESNSSKMKLYSQTIFKNLYGTCTVCREPMELCVNTYNDVSKPIDNISSAYIRDDIYENEDKQARYVVGALVLRCPKCHKIMTVKCPKCLKQGRISDMKVLVNYKRQHIFACCENYVSFADQVTHKTPLDKEDICNTSLVLYSDTKAKVVSEEQRRANGFLNWLVNYESGD